MQKKLFVSPEMEIAYFTVEKIASVSNSGPEFTDGEQNDNNVGW